MEQRLDATYLRSGPFERAAAVGFCAVAIGAGILLAAWGISFLWSYKPPEIRIANPEVTLKQDKPFEFSPPKIDPGPTIKAPPAVGGGGNSKTTTGEVIRREVTVFSTVEHGPGHVTTGWRYRDGTGSVPLGQYCYYSAPNNDSSSTRIEIAVDGARLPTISASLVPELEGALAKCQWWKR
jgi:hypothetical protein